MGTAHLQSCLADVGRKCKSTKQNEYFLVSHHCYTNRSSQIIVSHTDSAIAGSPSDQTTAPPCLCVCECVCGCVHVGCRFWLRSPGITSKKKKLPVFNGYLRATNNGRRAASVGRISRNTSSWQFRRRLIRIYLTLTLADLLAGGWTLQDMPNGAKKLPCSMTW